MKKYLPNFLTCLNLAIGYVGIYFTFSNQKIEIFYFVIIASLLDFLDGFVARMLKVQSEIGKQLDALSDVVSFGLLPSFFMLQWMKDLTDLYWIAIVIVVFSALRLAIFNSNESQSSSFRGLPTPANAIMLTSLGFISFELHEYTLISICIFSAILLVSPIRLIELKFSSKTWKENEERWVLIGGVVFLFVVFRWTFIPLLIPFYILISFFSSILIKRHRILK